MTACSAAEAAAQEKHSKQDADCENRGWVCIPLAVETFGAWCEEGEKAMCKLAGAVAARTNVPTSVADGALFEHLSIALQRANTRAIQRCYEFTRPALGLGLAVGREPDGQESV